MKKVSSPHILGSIFILGVIVVSGVFLFSSNKPSEAAFNSKFIEKVGEGFMAPACGSSGVNDSEFICNDDGTVTARIHWYPEKRLTKTECSNGVDDDGDGDVDGDDGGCASLQDDSETILGLQLAQCSDNIDNDSDGFRDYPADPGCIGGPGINIETRDKPQCSNG